tara:strand:+ start:8481 stop:8993 length:513 start_codon:yes stop_codon:yes gene_type:complete
MAHTTEQLSRAFVALGSNLGESIFLIHQAFDELAQLPDTRLLICSSLYKSAPVGRLDQPDFINAVAQIETRLAPHDLLTALLEIERRHGRVRKALNAPRTLDLDILMYDDLQYQAFGLTLPHPRITQRAFVLQPLLEISPDCYVPGYGTIAKLLAACPEQRIEQIQKKND